ncbi:hypothetical protein CTheo_5298 [Ceratobasidium theobromae]|uniref:Zn(2)-C6 fungal-type domain-containing protein n=1 Tax=Ceratobasidium theobromae TaxID=1582974 RepID=A0A5N5QIH6_9AGAM|nr:hypothetical protein CTheo_5298 [Ceratobasidium theobromae]
MAQYYYPTAYPHDTPYQDAYQAYPDTRRDSTCSSDSWTTGTTYEETPALTTYEYSYQVPASFGVYSPRQYLQQQLRYQEQAYPVYQYPQCESAEYQEYQEQYRQEYAQGQEQEYCEYREQEYSEYQECQQPEYQNVDAPSSSYGVYSPEQQDTCEGLGLQYGTLPAREHVYYQPAAASTPSPPETPSTHSNASGSPVAPKDDLYVQQRQAMGYQRSLEHRQNLKRQRSVEFDQLEANPTQRPRLNSYSSDSHLINPPIVPSQAHERPPSSPPASASPKDDRKDPPPPKKPALACLFCRKRKICCGPPPPDAPNRTCNQCARRKQPCEYPTESRRGIRKSKDDHENSAWATPAASTSTSSASSATPRGRGRRKRTESN